MLRFLALSFVAAGTITLSAEPVKPAQAIVAPASPAPPAATEPKASQPAPAPAAARPANVQVSVSQCNVEGPYLSITFDDGPHGAQTPRLLKMLKDRKIHATFFVLGQNVAEYPEIIKQMVDDGHEVASHSWDHPNLLKLSENSVRDQIERTHLVIKQTAGVAPTLFRPPYGNFTANQKSWAHATWGYKTILWDVDTNDWKHRSAAQTQSITLKNAKAGSIILCHDIHPATVDAMPGTLDGLLQKGFKFVTVSELLKMHRGPAPKAPTAKAVTVKDGAGAATSLEDLKKPQPGATTNKP